jgi:hypothetical protein
MVLNVRRLSWPLSFRIASPWISRSTISIVDACIIEAASYCIVPRFLLLWLLVCPLFLSRQTDHLPFILFFSLSFYPLRHLHADSPFLSPLRIPESTARIHLLRDSSSAAIADPIPSMISPFPLLWLPFDALGSGNQFLLAIVDSLQNDSVRLQSP